jgi:hypothetical protein
MAVSFAASDPPLNACSTGCPNTYAPIRFSDIVKRVGVACQINDKIVVRSGFRRLQEQGRRPAQVAPHPCSVLILPLFTSDMTDIVTVTSRSDATKYQLKVQSSMQMCPGSQSA